MSYCISCEEKCCKCGDKRRLSIYLTESDVENLRSINRPDLINEDKNTGTYWISTEKNKCNAFNGQGLCDIYPNRPEFCRMFPFNFLNVYVPLGESIVQRQNELKGCNPRWPTQSLFTYHPEKLPGREMRTFFIVYRCGNSLSLKKEEIMQGLQKSRNWLFKNRKIIPHLDKLTIELLEISNTEGSIAAYCPMDL
jgi:Fe-S-cluster containining protein